MERKRINYIDWLRIISALAVIGIHITMTQPDHYSVQELGKYNYCMLTCVCTLIQWTVPVFLMISGNLLLRSNNLTFTKIKKDDDSNWNSLAFIWYCLCSFISSL